MSDNMTDKHKKINQLYLNPNTDDDVIPQEEEDNDMNTLDFSVTEFLPILPLRNTVLFPDVVLPIAVGRLKSMELIRDAYQGNPLIGAFAQKEVDVEDPTSEDIHQIGTLARVMKVFKMPDNSTSVAIQGIKRITIDEVYTETPYIKARTQESPEVNNYDNDSEFEAIVRSLKETSLRIVELAPNIPPETGYAIRNIDEPAFLINFISSNTNISPEEKQQLLDLEDFKKRAEKLLSLVTQQVQKLELEKDIQKKVKTEMDQKQREYLLNQQIKTIQNELGGDPVDLEVNDLKRRAKDKKWPQEVKSTFEKELKRLERINPVSPEYSNQLNYLQTLLELPWYVYSKDNFDLRHATEILDNDHFGLEEVKDRILEHLAILKLKGDLKSPIICLYGPPGVGKTSLGKSVAKALNRKYVRMSLGGLHDEAEIRGHRKTYIGALPGRIIQSIKKAKTSNPVFILDEIDKIGNDFRGDPSFALLEVLDPEQNHSFYDNYLELEYDLSKILFIATANSLNTINHALRDRMEIINVSGYVVEEKVEIAKRHLIPKQLEMHGVKPAQLQLTKGIIEDIIVNYTRESGVRELEKRLAKVVRYVAKKIGFEEEYETRISSESLREILGYPRYLKDKYQGNEIAGIVTGLAWTNSGGKILFVESSLSRGNGKLTMTGNLGSVMRESAILAMEYLKAHSDYLEIDAEVFDNWNVHIHIPEGAIPKDGPSAGIGMLTSLASVFTQRKVRASVAMTGEITLRGKVLPVGGIKEKILAAKRAEIKEIILPEQNRKDIEEINQLYIKGLKFHYVDTMREVLDYVLLKQKVKHPMKISEWRKKNKRQSDN